MSSGSVRNKIVASDLLEERNKCAFDQQELRVLILGGQHIFDKKTEFHRILEKHPELANHHKFFEMTPEEQQTDIWRK